MKRILIIGKGSYIGSHIHEWLEHDNSKYCVEELDVLNADWKNFDYSTFDAIIHVAGIVHRPDCHDWNLYKSVNCDMPITIAKKAKALGVKAYIFFSTMGVYSMEKNLNSNVINSKTPLLTESMYGKSKLMAEEELCKLQDSDFDVSFVRPPSVYGKGCKGGYITGFAKIAKIIPVIPDAYNNARQSFIYIDNLSECVQIIIENNLKGVFCPQDDEIPNANRLLEVICNGIGKKYRSSKFLGLCLRLVSFVPLVKKAYGGIEYDRKLSDIPGHNYVVVPFAEGMKRSVEGL